MAVLERHIQVRQYLASSHEGKDFIHARIRIDIMQAHPGTVRLGNFAQLLHQLQHARLDGLAIPKARPVFHIDAVGRSVLTDDQQFLDATFK